MYDVPPSNTSYNHHSQAVEHLPDQLCTILRVLFMPKCFALNSRRPCTRTLFSTLSTVRPPTSDRCMPALTRMHRYTPTPIRRSTCAIAIRCRCDARRPSLHRGCSVRQGHRLTHESVSSCVCTHSDLQHNEIKGLSQAAEATVSTISLKCCWANTARTVFSKPPSYKPNRLECVCVSGSTDDVR